MVEGNLMTWAAAESNVEELALGEKKASKLSVRYDNLSNRFSCENQKRAFSGESKFAETRRMKNLFSILLLQDRSNRYYFQIFNSREILIDPECFSFLNSFLVECWNNFFSFLVKVLRIFNFR